MKTDGVEKLLIDSLSLLNSRSPLRLKRSIWSTRLRSKPKLHGEPNFRRLWKI